MRVDFADSGRTIQEVTDSFASASPRQLVLVLIALFYFLGMHDSRSCTATQTRLRGAHLITAGRR